MSHIKETKFGVIVRYCGHDASFVADIVVVAGCAVIRASGEPIDSVLTRPCSQDAEYHVEDIPEGGYWNPRKGILCVPVAQVAFIKKKPRAKR